MTRPMITRLILSVATGGSALALTTAASAQVIGHGTPNGCTSAAVVAAVRHGGKIRFDCGSAPLTIRMDHTAEVRNTEPKVVIDGGGLVTLSGEGRRRILYMNTCDPRLRYTTTHCEQQSEPKLVVKNLTLRDGRPGGDQKAGGGAIFAFGGRLTIEHSRFDDNRCARGSGAAVGGGAVSAQWQDVDHPVKIVGDHFSDNACDNGGAGGGGGALFATQNDLEITDSTFVGNRCPTVGPDVGGGAVRAYLEHPRPVLVTGSTFQANVCSNGGALSSIDASWAVADSTFTDNKAIGVGANPARRGTPGGGSGGAIYNDGHAFTLSLRHSTLRGNRAREGGGAIFFVSNNRAGTMSIADSRLVGNPNAGFHTGGLPGIFFLGAHRPTITHSVLKR